MAQIKFSQLPIAQTVTESAYASIIDLSQPIGSQNQIIPLSLLTGQGYVPIKLNGTTITAFDPNSFTQTNGVLSVSQVTPTTPVFTIEEVSEATLGGNISVIGSISGYAYAPALFIALNGNYFGCTTGLFNLVGSPIGTSTTTTFEFDNVGPLSTVGTYSINVFDFSGAVSATEYIIVDQPIAQSATIDGCATPITLGNGYFDNGTNSVSPDGALGWATVNDGTEDIFARQSFSNGEFPSFTAPAIGNDYTIEIYDSETGGNLLATSNVITVNPNHDDVAEDGALTNVPDTATQGTPIVGITSDLTGPYGYGVLKLGGEEDSVRVAFANGSYPEFAPSFYGSYVAVIYDSYESGSIIYTSSAFTVSVTIATACNIVGMPSTLIQGQPIDGIGVSSMTPAISTAWAVLVTNGTEDGARVAFTTNGPFSFPSLVPSNAGQYTIMAYDAASGGNILSQLGPFTISTPSIATAATISGSAVNPVHDQPINGFSVSLVPSGSYAYAVLAYDTGSEVVEDGARQYFFDGALPNLTPSQVSSGYQLWIVTTSGDNTGEFLAQSPSFAVT
jgi:hypothetical protein